jgi:hypothetical protein
MYSQLKSLIQDRGKKKKGQSKQGKEKIVETEGSSSQTPDGVTSGRSKGYIIGKDGKKSEYEASSTTPENKPKGREIIVTEESSSQTPDGQTTGRSKGYIMENGKKSEFEASSQTPENKPKSKVDSGPITPEGLKELREKQLGSGPITPEARGKSVKKIYKDSKGKEISEEEYSMQMEKYNKSKSKGNK